MRVPILVLALSLLVLTAQGAEAKSCSVFMTVESFDPGGSSITLKKGKGSVRKYFPKPEGATGTKIPGKCKSKVLKQGDFPVTATGGRLKITQIRENLNGGMLNDADDPAWLPKKLQELIDGKTEVCAVLRPPVGKKEPFGVSAIYMPITDEELKEIERLENQGSDVE